MPQKQANPVGRPRDETLTPRILRAAQAELAANGVEQFSVRGVARRAEVSRKTVATRWPDADDLLLAALGITRRVELEPSGDVRADLLRLGRMFVAGMDSDALDVQLRVTADAHVHPAAFHELRRRALEPTRAALVGILDRARTDGVIRDADTAWLADAFVGALFMRTVQNRNRRAPTRVVLTAWVDELLRWIAV